jgi:hypothetical protein
MGLKDYDNAQVGDRNVIEIRYNEALSAPSPGDTGVFAEVSSATITAVPGDGYVYHLFESPGTFQVLAGSGSVEMLAIGGGGGRGGSDTQSGNGGAGGGGSLGIFFLTPVSGILNVSIGGGGAGGGGGSNAAGGAGGTNGGGPGGRSGPSGSSGSGAGGGGWSGISTGSTYYVVGGGGAGGGGATEGPANNFPALGGGSPLNSYNPASLTGATGNNYPGDGGGYGGGGGGFDGSTGGGGNGGTAPISGGSNYVNPTASSSTLYAGGNGGNPANATAGAGATGFLPSPGWDTFIPADIGYGGGSPGATGTPPAGQPGIVVIRHSDAAY